MYGQYSYNGLFSGDGVYLRRALERELGAVKKGAFSPDMCIHMWAQQTQAWGTSNKGNVYFKGDELYSYGSHYMIARFVETSGGATAVLFNNKSYSVTTTRHTSRAWGASSQYAQFDVENNCADSKVEHKANLVGLLIVASEKLKSAKRARSNADWKARDYSQAVQAAKQYADLFVGPKTAENISEEDLGPVLTLALDTIKKVNKKAITDWRNGLNVQLAHNVPCMLRVSKSGSDIQTSQFASFPIEHAKRTWPLINRAKAKGGWTSNSDRITLGHFRIDSISARGDIWAGCHRVAYAEVERLAKTLNLV